MKAERLLEREGARRDAYKLLSTCYCLPDEDTMRKLSDLEQVLGVVCPEAAEEIAGIKRATELEELKVDYSRLFVGPFQLLAPPYGSIHLEGTRRVMGDSAIDARNRYAEAGLNVSQDLKEAPDHIAIELEFMYYLIFKEIEAVEESDLNCTVDRLVRQQQFLEDHLAVWLPLFAEEVEKGAITGFYRNLAKATRTFVRKDLEHISERLTAELYGIGAWPIGQKTQ